MRQSRLFPGLFLSFLVASLSSTTAVGQSMTDADLARLLQDVEPMVEAMTGRSIEDGVTISFVDADTYGHAIEQGLKSMVAPGNRDAGLNAAVSIVALQRSKTLRAAVDRPNRRLLLVSSMLDSAFGRLSISGDGQQELARLIIANGLARLHDAVPEHASTNLRTLDEFNVVESLREGWGLLVQESIARHAGWESAHALLVDEVSAAKREDPPSLAIRRQFGVHARAGEVYLSHARVRGGWPAVWRAMAEPPTSYEGIKRPGEFVVASADVDAMFAGLDAMFPSEEGRDWQRLSRRLTQADLRQTYGSLGNDALNEILGSLHHAYMFLQMAEGSNGSVTQAVTVFHLKDPSSGPRIQGYFDSMFDRQTSLFDELDANPEFDVQHKVDVGKTDVGEWTTRRVSIKSNREGAGPARNVMGQGVMQRGVYIVNYQGIAEPLSQSATVSLLSRVMRSASPGSARAKGVEIKEGGSGEAVVLAEALASASMVFDRSLWAVGRESIAASELEPMIGDDARAAATITLSYVDGYRLVCQSTQDTLLGPRKVEAMAFQMKDASSASTVAEAVAETIRKRIDQLSARPGLDVSVTESKTVQLPGGGQITTIAVDLGDLGLSSFRVGRRGDRVVHVVVADGDPAAANGSVLHGSAMDDFVRAVLGE